VALYDHLATLLPEFCAGSISTKRLPDSSEPWASDLCQAIPFDLLFEIACSSFIFISETSGQVIVSVGKILTLREMAGSVLPNGQGQISFENEGPPKRN
jgi:hypothetical protein